MKETKSATRHRTSANSSGVLPLPGNQSRMEKEKGVRFWQDHETREDSLLYITKWKVLGGKYWTFWHLKIVTYKVNLVKKTRQLLTPRETES